MAEEVHTLDTLLDYYTESSFRYKFKHTFNNIQDDLSSNPTVVIGHAGLNNRVAQQHRATLKLQSAARALESRANHLEAKARILREKVKNCVKITRTFFAQQGQLDRIYSIKREMFIGVRDRITVQEIKKEDVVKILKETKEKLIALKSMLISSLNN